MRKIGLISLVLLGIIATIALVFFGVGLLKPKIAGIYIETNPESSVYINGDLVGRTPYRDKREASEVVVRLIPESFEIPLAPYDAKIALVAGIETVIKRDFGDSSENSSGELISFEKIDKDQVNLVVVSIPDSAQVLIDGKDRAFTPHKTSNITPGIHRLVLTADGYSEKTVEVKTHQGYKLTAIVQLAESGTKVSELTPTPEVEKEEEKEMVEILSTPVGYLRVRKEPSTLADEVGRVNPGQRLTLLEVDEKTGWFKIELLPVENGGEAKSGWISNQYAKKVVGEGGISPTPTSKMPTSLTPTPKPTQPY